MQNLSIKPELLAPAGSFDAGCAAFEYGADAVYLGMKQFSARGDAHNFSVNELADLVGYARSFTPARKVYVTVNTLIRERELGKLIQRLSQLQELAVDAVIVQDFGVVRLLRSYFPDLAIHASTQMAIHNRQGVETAKKLGISRVIPARELTREEITDLCSVPDMEIEIFLHGALCYSYSGLCLFSAMEHGPSGNRGGCMYNCRNWFQPSGTSPAPREGMPFSMKDLCLDKELDSLLPTGVASLKIEGRKKSPLYGAAVTNYYRKLIDKTASAAELESLKTDVESIFHRPSTSLFINNRHNPGATDRVRSGHQGAAVGTVSRVQKGKLFVAVHSANIQRFDGLQIEIPGKSRPFGFGVGELLLDNGSNPYRTFQVEAGDNAIISLPPDYPQEISSGLTVYRSSSQDVKHRYKFTPPKAGLYRPRKAVNFEIEFSPEQIAVTAKAKELSSSLTLAGEFGPARNPEGTAQAVNKAFSKLGSTPFVCSGIHPPASETAQGFHKPSQTATPSSGIRLRNPQNLFVPASILNDLRREVTQKLALELEEKKKQQQAAILDQVTQPVSVGNNRPEQPQWILKTDQIELLADFSAEGLSLASEIIIDIGRTQLDDLLCGVRKLRERGIPPLRFSLPCVIRDRRKEDITAKIQALQSEGHSRWQLANPGQLPFFDTSECDVTADWSLYAWNSPAAALIAELGLKGITFSPEQSLQDILDLLPTCPLPSTVIVHQDVPLFNSAVCAKASLDQACPDTEACDFNSMTLSNSKGKEFLAVNNACETILINQVPFSRRDEIVPLTQIHPSPAFRVDFLWKSYTAAKAETIWQHFICA